MSTDFEKILVSMLDRVDSRLTAIERRLDESNQVQARHEENLKIHMNRSAAAEQALELLRSEVVPVKAHVTFVQTILKIMIWVGALIAGLASIYGSLR